MIKIKNITKVQQTQELSPPKFMDSPPKNPYSTHSRYKIPTPDQQPSTAAQSVPLPQLIKEHQNSHSKDSSKLARPEDSPPQQKTVSELQQLLQLLKTIKPVVHTQRTADGNGGHISNLNHTIQQVAVPSRGRNCVSNQAFSAY
ncbi:hypothetical protein Nepgr_033598 [Nepenthes gracilis]|uniref:Uncharacterized protein n=1 Tax=Nepenthes gracilis TaxID=150966 RepID=A0AAD3Y8S2_NEPGR|nr:hypothetical protein Nepgr_033598 [Nepenthes gracilis]